MPRAWSSDQPPIALVESLFSPVGARGSEKRKKRLFHMKSSCKGQQTTPKPTCTTLPLYCTVQYSPVESLPAPCALPYPFHTQTTSRTRRLNNMSLDPTSEETSCKRRRASTQRHTNMTCPRAPRHCTIGHGRDKGWTYHVAYETNDRVPRGQVSWLINGCVGAPPMRFLRAILAAASSSVSV